ncbi:hypothetical protein NAC36_002426 [Staphylococcus pseudintermedius]|uniref:hypothetical protein n=4 Tax=Staphylococcus pseudintermedius TaxID=283734 RepID=UPI000BBC5D77|nr:hypothetical protein [Staphylococcus pseudintermedius]EGQ2899966.1 hypothetical protein [Staphylococcus pseudintermedius]EGQ3075939.1 hypothetical protein [Staphylococcus pseudintermedius]EGQ3318390.1 hypothetical protein [Staphylococcus pseudintermedius]EGQ3374955.1 hypothetical protein [Staphylococcus pseudintermedius]EGQ3382393.1 hypothetical protein [Staphylococcus pseudintermedius]
MENNDILKKISILLKSDIKSSQIAKETGINKATISNLRRKNTDISKSSFETVNKLYNYYSERKDYFDIATNVEKEIMNIDLPKDVKIFISKLKEAIDNINDITRPLNISEVTLEKSFTMSKDKKSTKLMSNVKINELIPLQIKRSTYAYHLRIVNDFVEDTTPLDHITDFQINFSYNELEIALKRHIHFGNRVVLITSNLNEFGESQTGIYVSGNNGKYNYELKFISVSIFTNDRGGETHE